MSNLPQNYPNKMKVWVSREIHVQMKSKKGNRVNYNFDNNESRQNETGSMSHRSHKSIMTVGGKSVGTKSVGTKSNQSDTQRSYNQNLKNEVINKNGNLVDYIKYDSALGRD